jgi:hypothetical protein
MVSPIEKGTTAELELILNQKVVRTQMPKVLIYFETLVGRRLIPIESGGRVNFVEEGGRLIELYFQVVNSSYHMAIELLLEEEEIKIRTYPKKFPQESLPKVVKALENFLVKEGFSSRILDNPKEVIIEYYRPVNYIT